MNRPDFIASLKMNAIAVRAGLTLMLRRRTRGCSSTTHFSRLIPLLLKDVPCFLKQLLLVGQTPSRKTNSLYSMRNRSLWRKCTSGCSISWKKTNPPIATSMAMPDNFSVGSRKRAMWCWWKCPTIWNAYQATTFKCASPMLIMCVPFVQKPSILPVHQLI